MEENIPIPSFGVSAWWSKLQMRNFFGRLRKSAFVRNILVVMTGTAVAQIIGFALSPVISRLFSPTEFGIFGAFGAVAGVIGTATTLQYSQAIILPKKEADAINILALSCLCTLLISLLLLAACLIAPAALNGMMNTTGFWALALLVCATLVAGVNQSFQAWCVRSKAFKQTSASQVVRSVSSNGLQLGTGSLAFGAVGLVTSSVVADILATWNLGRIVLRDWRALGRDVAWQHMRRLANEYRDFPMYSATTNLINSLSLGLPMLLLTNFYGLAVAGAYAFAMRILSTPMGFVLTALRQVLLQKATEVHNGGGRLMPLYLKITIGLFAAALLPSLILMVWAPQFFSWVFGSRWALAGEFSSSLVIWLLFMFCNVPAALFGRIIRIQRQMFMFDLSVLLLRTLSLYLGGLYLSPSSTILFFSCVGGVMNIFFIAIVGYKLSRAEAGEQTIQFTSDLT
jgi:lipopolysaccharide exporter